MYKKIVLLALLFIALTVQTTFAVAELPKEKIFVEPVGVKTGTAIAISVFLYNDQKETITFTLEAKAGDSIIGKPVITLAGGSAKTVAIPWKQPKTQTTVTVAVVSAVNAKKVDIPTLHGSLGAILVGTVDPATPMPSLTVPTGVFGKMVADGKSFLETFRQKQATYFASQRDEAQKKLKIKKTPSEQVIPESPVSGSNQESAFEVVKADNPMDYGMLILSTALASFFASVAMFYGALILIVFLVLRFIFKMFI